MKSNLFRRILSVTAAACITATLAVSGIAANAEEPVNYAPNPGFENGSDSEAADWGLWPGWDRGSFITTEGAHGGSRAIKVELNADQNYALYAGRDGAAMNVSGAMKLSMWVKYTDVTGGFKIGLERKTKETNADAHVWGENITGSSDGWTQLTLDIPAAEEEIANINIKVEIAAGTGTLLVDDVVLTGEAPLPPEADPNKNYAKNSGFEDGSATEAGNWGLFPGWDKGSFITTEDVHGGSRAIKVDLSETQNYALFAGGYNGADFDLKSAATLSMWVKYTDVTGGFKIGLERKAGDTANDNFFGDMITGSSDGWTQISLDIPASQMDLTEWIIKVEIAQGTGTLLIDDVELKVGGKDDGGEDTTPDDKKPGVSITDAKGVNMLTNNGFENNDVDWGAVAGASVTTADTHSGAKAVKVVLDGNAPGLWSNLKEELSVDLSKAMKLSFWVKTENVSGDVVFGAEYDSMDADFNVETGSTYSVPLTGSSDWKKVTVDIPAAEGRYKMVVKLSVPEGSTGTMYFDDFHLTTADEADMNVLNYGGLDKTNNDTEVPGWAMSPEWPAAKFNHTDVHNGGSSVELALGESAYSLFQSSGWQALKYDTKQSMTFTAWVKTTGVTGDGVTVKIERKTGGEGDENQTVSEAVSTAVTGTSDGWVQLKVVAPAVTEEVGELIVSVNAAPGAGTVLVDDLQLRPTVAADTDNGGTGDSGAETGVVFPAMAVLAAVTGAAALVVSKKRA